ncbi:proline rich protein membrane protein [Streptomyces zinciresistens K42]|uniref:Proline rich protein membrane protein n=1 Tax=Streptomyces zinciresistens K42 TaxID=700597 RepID=G2GN99_9ACTN|nr:hypothetical protein [Streptomyces zinciresistens]EGX55010.1 proline rich protein membrane protein [Streptomyces zinciresistens K42]
MARPVPPSPARQDGLRHRLPWRWPPNPLRRPADVARAWIVLVLAVAVVTATPAAMYLAGSTAYRYHQRIAQEEETTRHRTTAVLVDDAPDRPEPGTPGARQARYPVTVRFTDPQGRTHTGEADAEAGLPAGSEIRVWADGEGRITGPPLSRQQVRDSTMGYVILAALAVPLVAVTVYRYATRRLERRTLAQWDAAWARTAPRWTTQP